MYLGLVTEHAVTRGLKSQPIQLTPSAGTQEIASSCQLKQNRNWTGHGAPSCGKEELVRLALKAELQVMNFYHDSTRENQEFCKKTKQNKKMETHK